MIRGRPMNAERRMRYRDLRALYLLVGSCRACGDDPVAWHARMAAGLTTLLDCRIGVSGMTTCTNLEQIHYTATTNLGIYDWGWTSPEQRRSYIDYCNHGLPATDPTLLRMAQITARVACRRRSDLVDDQTWFASRHYRDYFRAWGIGDFLYSLTRPAPSSGVATHWINLGRDAGRPPFSVRERRILWLFAREVCQDLGRSLRPFGQAARVRLSPRLIQVLQLLAEGQSEKRIAERLNLSAHTVHGYVKQLYRRFGVSNRSALLARWRSPDAEGGPNDPG